LEFDYFREVDPSLLEEILDNVLYQRSFQPKMNWTTEPLKEASDILQLSQKPMDQPYFYFLGT